VHSEHSITSVPPAPGLSISSGPCRTNPLRWLAATVTEQRRADEIAGQRWPVMTPGSKITRACRLSAPLAVPRVEVIGHHKLGQPGPAGA
jgi:hypothetical protein